MGVVIDKSRLVDSNGRPITQSLFLEIGYNAESAVFTFNDADKEYKGNTYYSLKKLFLEHEDTVEYDFATTYLLGWKHWVRLNENKVLSKHFQEWREELELRIRSQAVRDIIDMTAVEKSFQAAKWLADRGWDKKAVGRPSKADKDKDKAMQDRLDNEFSADVTRLFKEV